MSSQPDFPSVKNLGELPKFKELGLSLVSHKNPHIRLIGNELTVKFGSTARVKTLVKLTSATTSTPTWAEDAVFIQNMTDTGEIHILVNIAETGFWKLGIYAAPLSEESDTLIEVFNYVIYCNKIISDFYPYPKQFKQWSEGCRLYDPLILHKNVRGPSVHFKVKIPGADKVAVSVNDIQPWTPLKDDSKDFIFEGNVKLAEYYGKNVPVKLNARYGEEQGNSYSTLLHYTI